jgi:isopentenyl-diphosphate delta-isomerase
MKEYVILVNPTDQPVGRMEKMEAHEKGILHRAFSVFLFNDKGQTLLQQRASSKYHSPLLWTNTCCSHQRDGESNGQAASRRLQEELGIELAADRFNDVFSFVYRAEFDNGLTEHELDHVLVGSLNTYSGGWNPEEVASVRWVTLEEIKNEMDAHPEYFTVWFRIIFNEYANRIAQ